MSFSVPYSLYQRWFWYRPLIGCLSGQNICPLYYIKAFAKNRDGEKTSRSKHIINNHYNHYLSPCECVCARLRNEGRSLCDAHTHARTCCVKAEYFIFYFEITHPSFITLAKRVPWCKTEKKNKTNPRNKKLQIFVQKNCRYGILMADYNRHIHTHTHIYIYISWGHSLK